MKLDPRTKLIILVVTSLCAFLNNSILVECVFFGVPALLLLAYGRWRSFCKFLFLFALLLAAQLLLVPILPTAAGGDIFMFALYIRKLIPSFMLGSLLVSTTRVSAFLAAVGRLRLPKGFSISLAITLRYFPTMQEEWHSIKEAMGLRCRDLGEVSTAKTAAQVQAPTLKVESLAVRLGEKEILKNLNFQMQAGEIVAIAGPNGAGKTTLVRTLCGLQKPASGSILLDGSPLKDKARKKLSYLVMQDVGHQLFSDSVESECVLGVKEPDPALVAQALEWLDLDHLRQRHPLSLSGGQIQRLAVAVSLSCGKDLLAFDEPTSGLDRKSLKEVGLLLRELSQRRKLVLVITHDFELIQSACTRVLVLREGKLVADLSGEGRTKIREIWKE